MRRIHFLDFLKGVLIFLVVAGHFLQYGIYQGQGFWEDPLFKWIYMFHMPLFMALAGYLSQPGIDRVSAPRAIQTRFMAYVVPIIAWSTLYCLAVHFLMRPTTTQGEAVALPVYVLRQIAGDLWFLWALFGSIVVTVLARLAGRAFPVVYFISFFLVLLLPERGNVIFFKYTYPFFQIGYALARWGVPGFFAQRRALVFVLAAIPAILCYLQISRETYVYNSGMVLSAENAPHLLLRYAGAVSMSLGVWYALQFLYTRTPGRVKSVFEAFGRDSIYIYIIQNYVYMVVDRVGGRFHFPKPGWATGWLIALLAGFLICGACYFGGMILARNGLLAAVFFGKRRARSGAIAMTPETKPAGEKSL